MSDNHMRIVWFQFAQMSVVYPYYKDVGCMSMLNYLVKPPGYPREIISWGKSLLPMVLTICHTVNFCILSNLLWWARYSSNFKSSISKVGCCKVSFSCKLEKLWNFGEYNFGFLKNKQNKDLSIKILYKFHLLVETGCCINCASRKSYVNGVCYTLKALIWNWLKFSLHSNSFVLFSKK